VKGLGEIVEFAAEVPNLGIPNIAFAAFSQTRNSEKKFQKRRERSEVFEVEPATPACEMGLEMAEFDGFALAPFGVF